MHTRRLAALILGAWIAGSLLMAVVAMGNFRAVDRVLDKPAAKAEEYIEMLGKDSARTLLRHLASQQNRGYFATWELAQLGLGAWLAITLFLGVSANRVILFICGFQLLFVILQHWILSPQMDALGGVIDFAPADAVSPERVKFWRLHNAYSAFEVVKLALAIGLSVRLLVFGSNGRSRVKRQIREDVDAVHHANHSRVNG